MAVVKYRVDGRKSYSRCLTVTVFFAGLCSFGVWMLISSSVVPVQNSALPTRKSTTELEQRTPKTEAKAFEDSPGDLPEDATKGEDSSENNESKSKTSKSTTELEKRTSKTDSKAFEDIPGDLPEGATIGKDSSENNDSKRNSRSESTFDETSKEYTETKAEDDNDGERRAEESELSSDRKKNSVNTEKSSAGKEESTVDIKHEDDSKRDEKIEEKQDQGLEEHSGENKSETQEKEKGSNEILPVGAQSEILETNAIQNGHWSTQAAESENEKKLQKFALSIGDTEHKWKVCKVTAGPDYIPCLDNVKVIRKLRSTLHYEHRERHCPDVAPTCLVSLPDGYKRSIKWPQSLKKIWYYNVPHPKLAEVKGHQNWVKVSGEFLTFPGGGTQFKNGALHYIDFLQNSVPKLAWGKQTRIILDVGCGVASFGGYLFERDVLAMSFAPKDEHEAQVQFALERGIPALISVMGTKRLPYPSKVFDAIHCARCRVPWHIEGGKLLLELNRLLRPGGYFIWSATPVYRNNPEDSGIWTAMSELTKSMCWDLVAMKNDTRNEVGAAFYRKPTSNECYEKRTKNEPPLCKDSDNPDATWNVPLEACIHKVPVDPKERASQWPEEWPLRAEKAPSWLNSSQVGVYGKAAPEDFAEDYKYWKNVVSMSYMNGMGISWSSVRNVMDMKALYGGFAAALKDMNVWVMNVIPINSPDTLPLIYDRGFFGIYHDWCESFNTYPRTYDLLHADHIFSDVKKRCKILPVIAEVDRILRPEGYLIVRDKIDIVSEIESLTKSLQWKICLTYSTDYEGLLCVQKTFWRPKEEETIVSATE